MSSSSYGVEKDILITMRDGVRAAHLSYLILPIIAR
jgi:hypothetical protein